MKQSPAQADNIKKLEWAIWLSQQVDLGSLSEGDWLNIKEGLHDFIYFTGVGRIGPRPRITGSFSKEMRLASRKNFRKKVKPHVVVEIQQFFRDILRSFAQTKGIYQQYIPIRDAELLLTGFRSSQSPFVGMVFTDDVKAAASLTLGFHLVSAGITLDQIRTCPECQRIFLIKRKPRSDMTFHCSNQCARLAATWRYRERKEKKLKTKERERSRRRYVEKQKQKYGAKVKVARRPRRARGA